MMSAPIPPISIASEDFHILRQIAVRALEERHPVSGFLVSELNRADVHDAAAPLRCVRLDDWVTFRADEGMPLDSRMLVLPAKFRSSHLHVSVLSPVGAALIGLHAGSSMPYVGIDGVRHVVTVENLDPPAGVVSLQHHRAMKFAARHSGNDPDRPGPTAA
ncbi:MAG: GreA/GreB family elongation factor [Afipia sp.]|jgi:regulator of nucleoside diphosphate kinase|nr:GreA/GreB family elongation factor [Afipia sp.]WIG52555.1 MAG: hypothetical protein OJF48_003474 [Afipia sp.]